MKRLILMTSLFLGIGIMASAQTTGSNSPSAPQGGAKTGNTPKTKKLNKKSSQNLNQRKNYQWKDGQKATPTGHEATGTGSGYSAPRRDSAATTQDTTRKTGE